MDKLKWTKLNEREEKFVSQIADLITVREVELLKLSPAWTYSKELEDNLKSEWKTAVKLMYIESIKQTLVTKISKLAKHNDECAMEYVNYGSSKEKSQGHGMKTVNNSYIHELKKLL